MPYLNEDGTLDTWKGYIRKCDHCGAVEKVFDEPTDIRWAIFRWAAAMHNAIAQGREPGLSGEASLGATGYTAGEKNATP